MTERLNADQDPVHTGEVTERARQWEARPDQLPTTFAMSTEGDPQEIFDYYDKFKENDTAKDQPAFKDVVDGETRRQAEQARKDQDRKSDLEFLGSKGRERLRRIVESIGGAGLRFA